MRLRVRSRSGVNTVKVDDSITVANLLQQLTASSISSGFPPRPVNTDPNTPVSSVLRDGDTVIIQPATTTTTTTTTTTETKPITAKPTTQAINLDQPSADAPTITASKTTSQSTTAPSISNSNPINKNTSIASHGTMVMRQVPDDNSCLFRSVAAVVGLGESRASNLRRVISDTVLSRPDEFSVGILEKEPIDYAAWIQSDHAWGGAIELSILADHFKVQLAAFDVHTMRLDRYGQSSNYPTVAYLIYDGIHYNYVALALGIVKNVSSDSDIMQFDLNDEVAQMKVREIAQTLHDSKQYTDTASFKLKCGQCGTFLRGEKHAVEHARATGHTQFDES